MAESQKYYLGDTVIYQQYLGNDKTLISQDLVPVQSEATAFLTATGITDATITEAINSLVYDMKVAGIWTKMIAVYPFVGGTSDTHKYNLIDPQDTEAAYRINGLAGWTNDSNGVTAPGSGAANTFINVNSELASLNSSISIYVGTNVQEDSIDMGGVLSGIGIQLVSRNTSDEWGGKMYDNTNNNYSNTDSRGFYQFSRDNASTYYAQRNGVRNTTTQAAQAPSIDVTIGLGALSSGAAPATKQYRFASAGEALTTTQMDDYYDIVQSFQTKLSRQV